MTDQNQPRELLTIGLDLLGGYDDNLLPAGSASSAEFVPRPSGYTGLSVARLSYAVESNARAFDLGGRSYMNTHRNLGVTPKFGGDVTARARRYGWTCRSR